MKRLIIGILMISFLLSQTASEITLQSQAMKIKVTSNNLAIAFQFLLTKHNQTDLVVLKWGNEVLRINGYSALTLVIPLQGPTIESDTLNNEVTNDTIR